MDYVDDIWAAFTFGSDGWSLHGTTLREKGRTVYIVIASPKTVIDELNHSVRTERVWDGFSPFVTEIPIASDVRIKERLVGGAIMGTGHSYQEAMRSLFDQWSPDSTESELPRAVIEIGPTT